jgi:hypothetical protein
MIARVRRTKIIAVMMRRFYPLPPTPIRMTFSERTAVRLLHSTSAVRRKALFEKSSPLCECCTGSNQRRKIVKLAADVSAS